MEQDNLSTRQKAEESMNNKKSSFDNSESDYLKLVHELEVHQIELKIKNEELLLAKEKAEIAAKKYTDLYDFAPSGYFTLSKDGKILGLNIRGSKMLGKERSLLINSLFGFFVTDETKPIFNSFLKEVFSGKANEVREVCLSAGANEDFPKYARLTGIRDENMEQCHVTAIDITEQIKTQKALAALAIHNKTLLQTASDSIHILDEYGNVVDMNSPFCKLLGYTREELTRMNVVDWDIQWLKTDFSNKIAELIDKPAMFATKFRRKDGEVRDVEIYGTAITLESHKYLYASARDITERKLVEEKLAKISNVLGESVKALNCIHQISTLLSEDDKSIGAIFESVVHHIHSLYYNGITCARIAFKEQEFITDNFKETPWKISADIITSGEKSGSIDVFYLEENPAFDEVSFLKEERTLVELLAKMLEVFVERKQAKEMLQESEKQYRLLSENTTDGVLLFEDNIVKYASKGYSKMLGFDKDAIEDIPLEQIYSLIHEDDSKHVQDIIEAAYSEQAKSFGFEYRILNKEGEYVWLEDTINAKYDSLGNHIRSIIHSRNITERKQADDLVNQIHQNYVSYFNTIDEFLFVLNEQGNIIYTNSTVIDRLGYTREELTGKSLEMMYAPEKRDEVGKIVGGMLSVPAVSCLFPLITKRGTLIPAETIVTAGLWDGKPALFGVTKDISRIQLSEEKFSKVFYLNPSICGLTDLVTGEYIEVNEAFYNVLGFDKDEVIGKTPIELGILTESVIKSVLEKAKSLGQIYNIDATLRTKDGSIRQVLMSAEDITINDKILRYTVVNDITERKHLEDEISRTNVELQRINAEKDKFFSIIAHDLRSPFTGLLGLTELMTAKDKMLSIEEFVQMSHLLRESVVNVYQLLENLLEWAMVQKNMVDFTPKELRLSDVFSRSIKSIDERARQKAITIFRACPDSIGESTEVENIFADEKMISTVIRNLLTNAVKFTGKGGTVTIGAKETEAGMVEISVTDTGIGIHKDVIDKLFIVGEKVGTTGTENEPSTGLGLILCKEFVEKHGGKIWVESRDGIGSTFYFTVPKLVV